MGVGTDTCVNALKVFNGDLIVGGEFTTAGGVSANYIAKWNSFVGINEYHENSMSIYPNPTNQFINLCFGDIFPQTIKISLMNSLGEELLNCGNTSKIDVTNLDAGIYYLQIATPDSRITKKIIIQH